MQINDTDFKRLYEYMHSNFGVNLTNKRTLIEGRLGHLITHEGFGGFTDFLDDVFADRTGKKVDILLTRLTTNYTYFMREDAHYKFMVDVALPEWTQKTPDRDLRIWSAACASGEEAFTAAMVVNEYFGTSKSAWDTGILATDISPKALEEARTAVYKQEQVERLPEAWVRKYFDKHTSKDGDIEFTIRQSLKSEISFAQFNLMGSFARFRKKFHIIFCRNVMIYFDAATKTDLTNKFFDVLLPGGYLFIGQSETLTGINSRFTQIKPAIYQK